MAEQTGSAREEAERLVATLLAIAQTGLGSGPDRGEPHGGAHDSGGRGGQGDDDSLTAEGARLVHGLTTLGGTLAGFAGQLADAVGGQRTTATQPAGGNKGGGGGAGGADRPASSGVAQNTGAAAGDAWSRATDGDSGRGTAPADAPWSTKERAARPHGAEGRGSVRYGFATGSVECCVCPICRTIAGLRNPTPESAARLAGGAGDLAAGVVSVMRGLSAMSGQGRNRTRRPGGGEPKSPARRTPADPDLAWSAATRTTRDGGGDADEVPDAEESPWAAATRAAAREAAAQEAAARAAAREAAARAAAREAAARAAAREQKAADTPATRRTAAPKPDAPSAGRSAAAHAGDVWAAATAGQGVGRADENEAGEVTVAGKEVPADGTAGGVEKDSGPDAAGDKDEPTR